MNLNNSDFYILKNNIASISDIVDHIYHLTEAEVVISDSLGLALAIHSGKNSQSGYFCFQKDELFQHCFNSLNQILSLTHTFGKYDGICWAGMRVTQRKVSINDNIFFCKIEKYLLDSDPKVINEEQVKQHNCTPDDTRHLHNIFETLPILSQDRINELLDLMEICLIELHANKQLISF